MTIEWVVSRRIARRVKRGALKRGGIEPGAKVTLWNRTNAKCQRINDR
jgi:hypothetical protein